MTSRQPTERDILLVHAFVVNGLGRIWLQSIPNEVIRMIWNFSRQWEWDPDTNHDKKLVLSPDGRTVTCPRVKQATASTIFTGDWINDDGVYCFKFKFHGDFSGNGGQICIGLVTKLYDVKSVFGIGLDQHGWAWSVSYSSHSAIYPTAHGQSVPFGLKNGDEFIFVISIQNGKCVTKLHYQSLDEYMPITIQSVQPPLRLGVSMNARKRPFSLRIIENPTM